MVMSMTGFGRAELSVGTRDIIVEIKSVNHRYYEFSCRTGRAAARWICMYPSPRTTIPR